MIREVVCGKKRFQSRGEHLRETNVRKRSALLM
jgi:hypothetical protein